MGPQAARFQLCLLIASLALLLAPAGAWAQGTTAAVSGTDLINDCGNYPDSQRPRNCAAFAAGIAEILRSDDRTANPRGRLCISEDIPANQIVAAINDWLARNPNAGNMSGYDVAYNALEGSYRCK